MEALNKKDVVNAVEKHGKILAVEGRFEKPKKIISHMYAYEKRVVKPEDLMNIDLNQYDVVLIGCPGDKISGSTLQKIRNYVILNGGWLITTDWTITNVLELAFPGFIKWNGKRTADAVVACQIIKPNHPFLDGVLSEIQQGKWAKKSDKNIKKDEFRWWLENRSFPIMSQSNEVQVLIASWELKNKWGESPVLVTFPVGKKGGRIIHMISHAHLQKGSSRGKYISALILTNILDEKVSQKVGISRREESDYFYKWQTPSTTGDMGLTGTSQIIEVSNNSISLNSVCVYCDNDFNDFIEKILMCQACGTLYHENCLNLQINEGTCKKCGSILLW